MALRQVSEDEILRLGLEAVGFGEKRQQTNLTTKVARFQAYFGASPKTCIDIFSDIQGNDAGDHRINKPDVYHYLMTLHWLNSYPTHRQLAGTYQIGEQTVGKWLGIYTPAIQALKDKKIVWHWNNDEPFQVDDPIFILSVDGTHCRIKEPRKNPNSQYYSHKTKKAGLNYEIALDLYEDKVAWVYGPVPAGQTDIHVFRKADGLKWKIPIGKKIIGDNGYQGDIISAPNPLDTDAVKKFKKRARARHETLNSKIKEFEIVEQRFRHALEKHKGVFEAVVVIIQYELDNNKKHLFKI